MRKANLKTITAIVSVLMLLCITNMSVHAEDDDPGMIFADCDLKLPENMVDMNARDWMSSSFTRAGITILTLLDFGESAPC